MAQQFVTDSGTLIIPSAVSKITVQRQNSGLATSGIIALVGEADSGPDFTLEEDLEVDASYGPDEASAVIAKYGSGSVVDAYRAASQPSNDPNIVGAPSRLIIVKTNASTKATSTLVANDAGTYGALVTKVGGRLGNQLYRTVEASAVEVIPTSGAFTWIPPVASLNMAIRLNGGAALAPTITANITPTAFVSAITGLTGIDCSGGAARTTIQNSVGTLTVAVVSGNAITITYASGTFTTTPSVGDTVVIPQASVIVGAAYKNVGAYVVTAATSSVISCTKLSDAGFTYTRLSYGTRTGAFTVGQVVTEAVSSATGTIIADQDLGGNTGILVLSGAGAFTGGHTITDPITGSAQSTSTAVAAVGGTITAPQAKTAVSVSGTAANDLVVYASVTTITPDSTTLINGIGKSLEVAALTTGTDLLTRCIYDLDTTPVTWVSTSAVPALLTSATESAVQLNIARQNDAISEELIAGGDIALKLSYKGTTATITITETTLAITRSGGTGDDLALTLSDFSTIADLAAYINAQTDYSAAVGNTTLGQLPVTALDWVTAQGICSSFGAKNGRIKIDAYKFNKIINDQSSVVELTDGERATAGLPAVALTTAYFSGGAKGATLAADVVAALAALEEVSCNFVVTCFSRDAADDIADGLTDSASTYAIDAVNAGLRTHVLAMSKLKKRRNRQGFASIETDFDAAREAASNLASFRVAMTFQDVKNLNSSGTIVQFQPWMGASVAAGMQAAGFYRAIVRKFANISGTVMADASFSDRNDTQMENALLSGLLPLRRHASGGFYWVSDQTTYSKDDNFVFNSIQAVYAADIIAMTTAQRMEDAFVGQSVADVSASAALTFLEGIMADFRRLKLIAASDDAPAGFKNARITISGSAMIVEVEVKLAGAIYFIPISFLVSPVQQTASQG